MSAITKNSNSKFYFFLLVITIINFLQAYFTEITLDESYYDQYAKVLDWGYYDHPPMVALLIKISQIFFSGNLGVRFMTVLLFTGNIFLVWKYLLPKNKEHYFKEFVIISLGLVMMNAYSFITTPDVPLLFFVTIFFIFYKNFLAKENIANSVLLGISIALMFYSKYQGVLVLFFVLLSNLRLFTRIHIYIAGFVVAVLMIPHLMWHINHNFPSFQYHLVGRSTKFEIKYFFEYLPNQFAVFNPFILIPFIIILIKNKYKNLQEKAYYYVCVGLLVFFGVTSFRGHAEPHWTVAASVPLLILFLRFIQENPFWKKYTNKWIFGSLILVLAARVLLMTPVLPKKLEFYGKKEKYEQLYKKVGNVPVLFTGSFQQPSLYQYFTNRESSTLGSLNVRKTQYDIWQKEQNYFGKKIFVVISGTPKSVKIIDEKDYTFEGFYVEQFQTPNRLKIDFELTSDVLKNNQKIPITISNPTKNAVDFNHKEIPVNVTAVFFEDKNTKYLKTDVEKLPEILKPGQSFRTNIKIHLDDVKPGEYNFAITAVCIIGNAYNSKFRKVKVN